MKILDIAFWTAVAGVLVSFVMAIVTMNAAPKPAPATFRPPVPIVTPAGI